MGVLMPPAARRSHRPRAARRGGDVAVGVGGVWEEAGEMGGKKGDDGKEENGVARARRQGWRPPTCGRDPPHPLPPLKVPMPCRARRH